MVVYYAVRKERVVLGHGDCQDMRVITSPVFAGYDDCKRYIADHPYECYGCEVFCTTVM